MKRKRICCAVEECYETKERFSQFILLGEGSSGSVYKATEIKTGKSFAIKWLKRVLEEPINTKRILREVRILRLLQGKRHVIGFRGILKPENLEDFCDLFLLFEYYESDIDKLRTRRAPFAQFFDNYQIQCLLYQLLISIKYMHSQRVIHRDLKPGNLLVNANCALVVCDFGLARLLPVPVVPVSPIVTALCLAKTAVCRALGMGCKRIRAAASAPPQFPPPQKDLNEDFFSPLPSPLSPSNNSSSSKTEFFTPPPLNLPLLEKKVSPETISEDKALELGPPPLVRSMTRHVVTRHYRAPEIQLAQDYTASIDMWAAGCIFADLLGMQQESCREVSNRHAIFPGRSSAFTAATKDENDLGDEKNAQLNAIFDVRGTPGLDELSRVCTAGDVETQAYVTTLRDSWHPPKDLHSLYPGADPLAIDLLQSLLQFDPAKRPSAEGALLHPYLQCIRDSKILTKSYGRHDEVIPDLSFTVDFGFEDDRNLTVAKLRALLVSEIRLYNP